MYRSLFITLIILNTNFALAADFDDVLFCKEMESFAEKGRTDIGKMIDGYTRNDGVTVMCGNRIVDFKKFLLINEANLREGWKDRKAAQWESIYCDGVWLEAVNNGWTIAFTLTTQDGKRFWYKASCDK